MKIKGLSFHINPENVFFLVYSYVVLITKREFNHHNNRSSLRNPKETVIFISFG